MKMIKFYSILGFVALNALLAAAVDAQPLPPGGPALPSMPANGLPMLPPTGAGALPPVTGASPLALPSLVHGQPELAAPVVKNAGGLPEFPKSTQPTRPAGIVAGLTATNASPSANGATSQQFSYGASALSVLFLPSQIDGMKQAISAYESTHKDGVATSVVTPEATPVPVPEKIAEPAAYPAFYLSSIVYHAPNDWSLWVGGQKITSRTNNTDVTVLHVSPDSVTFSWQPVYEKAIARRRTDKLFAATDSVKNKLAVTQLVGQDSENGTVTFTLKQNQTFAVGYFKVFEGFVESPQLEPMSGVEPNNSTTMVIGDTPEGSSSTAMPPDPMSINRSSPAMPRRHAVPSGAAMPPASQL